MTASALRIAPNENLLRARREYSHDLPAQATPLIGRDQEVESVFALLTNTDVRLVTMTGPPGVGKTRLSLQVAADVASYFQDGVHFVPLAAVTTPKMVPLVIAQALGLKEVGKKPLEDRVAEYLHDKEMLLLLDNFEHVASAAPLISQMLAACPWLKVMATSRTLLRIYGEHHFPLHPFKTPAGNLTNMGQVAASDAVQLFVQRARAVKPTFQLTHENAEDIVGICASLDGLPLAIELAAARIKLLPPEAILRRLTQWGQRLHLLNDGARDLPERQQTLRNAIGWSFDLLDNEEQRLLMWLSVFVGGFTLEAAESVYDGRRMSDGGPQQTTDDGVRVARGRQDTPNDRPQISDYLTSEPKNPKSKIQNPKSSDPLDAMASLVDKSLVQQVSDAGGEPRFALLETIREYLLERLAASGELDAARWQHAHFYLRLAEEADTVLQGTTHTVGLTDCLERLELEKDNIRAAFDWSTSESHPYGEGATELALRLAGALWLFWEMRGYLTEGRERVSSALTHTAWMGHSPERARAMLVMGKLAMWQGEYDLAHSELEDSLDQWREIGDELGMAYALGGLGHVARGRGDYESAKRFLGESAELRRKLGHLAGLSSSLHGLGAVAFFEGEYEKALTLLNESVEMARRADHKWILIHALNHLGQVTLHIGENNRAAETFREMLAFSTELGDRSNTTRALIGLAKVECARDQPGEAATFFGAANAMMQGPSAYTNLADRADYEHAVASVRETLGPEAFQAAWETGKHLAPQELLGPRELTEGPTTMLTVVPERDAAEATTNGTELSEREFEVLQAVTMGHTNVQVADMLSISPHTVNNHLRSIFSKLGVSSRSALTRYAIVNKLV